MNILSLLSIEACKNKQGKIKYYVTYNDGREWIRKECTEEEFDQFKKDLKKNGKSRKA